MQNRLLIGKKILLGVTGSIAIYKSLELIRLFIKAGAEVKVVMSEDAKRFITPLTFETISQNKVLHAETESWSEGLNHIHIGKWADLFVIAPCSVNTINKLGHGTADNLITQSAIAFAMPMVIAPSANTNMMLHPITQQSLQTLLALGYEIVSPVSKRLACNDEGVGALAEVKEIFYACARTLLKDSFWIDREVIITGGGTREKIDDVRYLSNFSSGKQASSLALAAYLKGAKVWLLSSAAKPSLQSITHTPFGSSAELHAALEQCHASSLRSPKVPYLFMAAAISDFIPKHPFSGKLKKEHLQEEISLELVRNADILASFPKEGFKTIGFKAECDAKSALHAAQKMLKNKGLDAVCLNVIGPLNPFGGENNACTFITHTDQHDLALSSKLDMAFSLLEAASKL